MVTTVTANAVYAQIPVSYLQTWYIQNTLMQATLAPSLNDAVN